MTNPFVLPGPIFLAFYAILALVLLLLAWIALRFTGGEARFRVSDLTSDPYRIACLRDGKSETIRIALFNLVDRGLISLDDEYLVAVRGEAAQALRRPLDRAILAACSRASKPKQVMRDARVQAEAVRYHAECSNKGLLHSSSTAYSVIAAGCALLAGVAIAKIGYALVHGRTNVLFLMAMSIAACTIFATALWNARTRAGAQMLSQVRELTRRLKARATTLKSGGATNEALLLASVFGLSALPAERFAFIETLFPKPKSSDGGGGDGGGGSGCGGGGGCGGCGGCGS